MFPAVLQASERALKIHHMLLQEARHLLLPDIEKARLPTLVGHPAHATKPRQRFSTKGGANEDLLVTKPTKRAKEKWSTRIEAQCHCPPTRTQHTKPHPTLRT